MKQVRSGHSYREAARRWRVGVATVALWMQRAKGRALTQVDWQDRSSRPAQPSGRTPAQVVAAIRHTRRQLQCHDALGEHGPAAIRRQLLAESVAAPSERTIARWLARTGLSGRERWRRPPPPKGWYLAAVAAGRAEVDSCDVVEGLCLRGGRRVEVLNTLSLWGCTATSTVAEAISTAAVIASLQERWQLHGRPHFLQCDNDTIFTGAHAQRQYLGRLVHWCLCVGVVPIFAPPAELGFQAAIEAYNRRWQERVWRRWHHRDLAALRGRSAAFVVAYNRRDRRQVQVPRLSWLPPRQEPCAARIVLLRRLDAAGALTLCAQRLRVAAHWAHRLVRCELDVRRQRVRIYGLRRRDPLLQPLLADRALRIVLVPWHRKPS
ncbi:MAG: hypothetical protein ABI222_11595 [Opitutaceae bacterium]